jgi:hypothetical protein
MDGEEGNGPVISEGTKLEEERKVGGPEGKVVTRMAGRRQRGRGGSRKSGKNQQTSGGHPMRLYGENELLWWVG